MFIIIVEQKEIKNVATIVYGKDINKAREWVYNYLIKRIEDMENISMKNTLGYKIIENDNMNKYTIIKEYKEIDKGYIYNSYIKKLEPVLSTSILEYNETSINKIKFLQQYHQILIEKNNEIPVVIKEKRE
jgi:hypothetical protein